MDLTVHVEAFRLGTKRSSIVLPWETKSFQSIMGKKPRLIPAPTYPAAPLEVEPDDPTVVHDVIRRSSWTRRTSLVPWPVVQDKALSRVLESWRIILMDNLEASTVGQQILVEMAGDNQDDSIAQILKDALAGKSLSTLRSRASSILAFARWKKGLKADATIFPINEPEVYSYVQELKQHQAPVSRASRFVESLTFVHYMIGAEVDWAFSSPRVKGALVAPMTVPLKKDPLTVEQLGMFEFIATNEDGNNNQVRIFAGYVCFVAHARLRWSDGQYCNAEPYTDLTDGRGFLEAELYHHKNAGRQRVAKRLLPAACVLPGVSGVDWGSAWLSQRLVNDMCAGYGIPTMPAPLADGGWALVPLESDHATSWIRELIGGVENCSVIANLGTHSLKATLLSWLAKANCDTSLRRLAGYHVDSSSKMALEYSRDAQSPVLHAVQGIFLAVQMKLFLPDVSRSRRWPNPRCQSLQQCMEFISKSNWHLVDERGNDESLFPDSSDQEGAEPPHVLECASDVSSSDLSDVGEHDKLFEHLAASSDEDRQAQVDAPIVGHRMAREVALHLEDVTVFRHRVSQCCHVSKEPIHEDDLDGDMVVLRCGKIATRNFERVEDIANFMPYKCSRCFSET